ncbi:hypothetical protein BHE74_00040492 [Ensete ventricosum]|nr:hypothetical protein BHE74_00040492 [Ensete ventricosum]
MKGGRAIAGWRRLRWQRRRRAEGSAHFLMHSHADSACDRGQWRGGCNRGREGVAATVIEEEEICCDKGVRLLWQGGRRQGRPQ